MKTLGSSSFISVRLGDLHKCGLSNDFVIRVSRKQLEAMNLLGDDKVREVLKERKIPVQVERVDRVKVTVNDWEKDGNGQAITEQKQDGELI